MRINLYDNLGPISTFKERITIPFVGISISILSTSISSRKYIRPLVQDNLPSGDFSDYTCLNKIFIISNISFKNRF